MALLDICETTASRLGLRQPATVVGSTDLTAQVLLALANEAGKHLMRYHDWQNLIVEVTATASASVVPIALAADFDRMIYNPAIWNATTGLQLFGPTPQRVWRQLTSSGLTIAGVGGYWRLRGNALNVRPVMTAGDLLEFEYISKNWCESSGGTGQTEFMADTDVTLVDEELFVLEMVWRFRKSRGFGSYAEDLSTAEREKEKLASRDRGTGRIRSSSGYDLPPLFWPGSIDG